MQRKTRVPIPPAIAAQVLFEHDRTCCICRTKGRSPQIHHIDDNPANNDPENLSVLCLECHRDTQLVGGFDRKLDAHQVRLYRNDWRRVVADARATSGIVADEDAHPGLTLRVATTLAEALNESGDWFGLARHYETFGNEQLRDKYAGLAAAAGLDPLSEVTLRLRVQHRPDLVSPELVEQVILKYKNSPIEARMLKELGRLPDAAASYCRIIARAIANGNSFSAAFYLKELASLRLEEPLFKVALEEAAEGGELWWQMRAMEELGWADERRKFILAHADEIRRSGRLEMLRELALAEGDEAEYVEVRKQIVVERAQTRAEGALLT